MALRLSSRLGSGAVDVLGITEKKMETTIKGLYWGNMG